MIRFLIVLSLLTCLRLPAQEAAAKLAEQTDKIFAKWDSTVTPGCALSVMKDGRIIYKRGYGMADLDHDVPITTQTVFHVASISKQFTAAAVLLLAQEGKLSLDDDVHKYIKELPDFGLPITIRQLMHHTSGLRDQWALLDLAGWRYSLDLITDEDVLSLMERQKELNFKPGEKYLYCNTGFTLLGQIVKRVSGQTLREFTTSRIFGPLGMTRTHFRDDHAEIVKQVAYGYEEGTGRNVFRLSVTNFDTVGATSLLTTVEDLANWDENFYHPTVGGSALVEQQLLRGKLNSGKEIDYAAGLVHGTYRGLKTVDHGGADAGYRAHLIRFPKQHFAVACLCNQAETNPGELARKVADVYLAGQFKEPAPQRAEPSAAPPVTLSAQQAAKWAGMYWEKDEERAWRIVRDDAKLYLRESEEDRVALVPQTEKRFQLGEFPVTLTFDESGMSVGQPGQEKPDRFERVTEFHPTQEQLSRYAGDYASAEIDPIYRIRVEDGRLVLRRFKAKPSKLSPVINDYFYGSDGTVHFVRNAAGDVSGFELNRGRVRHFAFKKVRAS
jgi:CubicO group peptidase (beta-lactamase class C family)